MTNEIINKPSSMMRNKSERSKRITISSTMTYGVGVDLRKGLLQRRARTAALANLHKFYGEHPNDSRVHGPQVRTHIRIVRQRSSKSAVNPTSAPLGGSSTTTVATPSDSLKRSSSFDSSPGASSLPSINVGNRRVASSAANKTATTTAKSSGRRTRETTKMASELDQEMPIKAQEESEDEQSTEFDQFEKTSKGAMPMKRATDAAKYRLRARC